MVKNSLMGAYRCSLSDGSWEIQLFHCRRWMCVTSQWVTRLDGINHHYPLPTSIIKHSCSGTHHCSGINECQPLPSSSGSQSVHLRNQPLCRWDVSMISSPEALMDVEHHLWMAVIIPRMVEWCPREGHNDRCNSGYSIHGHAHILDADPETNQYARWTSHLFSNQVPRFIRWFGVWICLGLTQFIASGIHQSTIMNDP